MRTFFFCFLLLGCFPIHSICQDNVIGTQTTIDGDLLIQGDLKVNGRLTVTGDVKVTGDVDVDGEFTGNITPGSASAPATDEEILIALWKIDQAHNGLSVTLRGENGQWLDPAADLRLDEQGRSTDPRRDEAPRPLIEIHNADKLQATTYTTVRALFDNYQVRTGLPEDELGENATEDQEVKAFLDAAMETQVIQKAREFANAAQLRPGGGNFGTSEFRALIKKQWFELFTNHYSTPNSDCSGFEHVFLGDYSGNTIGGHHFWWKYYLDENGSTPTPANSLGHKYKGPQGDTYKWLATFRMEWKPEPGVELKDPEQKGFFVGCSPELMLAYGSLGLLMEKKAGGAHPVVNFDGGRYELTIHASTVAGTTKPDDRRGDHIRTVFPKLQAAGSSDGPRITVAEALAAGSGEFLHVTGVITGAVNGQFGLELRDAPNAPQRIAVKLPKTFRPLFNPELNNEATGKRVVISARRGSYTGVKGLVDVANIEALPPE